MRSPRSRVDIVDTQGKPLVCDVMNKELSMEALLSGVQSKTSTNRDENSDACSTEVPKE